MTKQGTDVPEAVLRSLSTVREPGVASGYLRLLSRASPSGRPTRATARSICKLVREAVVPEKNGAPAGKEEPFAPLFLRPVHRLARMDFDVAVACLHVRSPEQAERIIEACEAVIDRCRRIQEQLHTKFAGERLP